MRKLMSVDVWTCVWVCVCNMWRCEKIYIVCVWMYAYVFVNRSNSLRQIPFLRSTYLVRGAKLSSRLCCSERVVIAVDIFVCRCCAYACVSSLSVTLVALLAPSCRSLWRKPKCLRKRLRDMLTNTSAWWWEHVCF